MSKTAAEQARERRARNYATPKDPNDPRHGTPSFYQNHGCRCDRCTRASTLGRAVQTGRVEVSMAPPIFEKSFAVIEYTNRQGSKIIAALDNDANWNVLCMAAAGHIHHFKWTHPELAFDVGDAQIVERTV